jgi:parallel beta-helix repeat protein
MMRTHAKYIVIMTSLTIACFVQAGSLEPMGPPSSTMKTLTEVEPRTVINVTNTPGDINNSFIINEPGSYYLVAPFVGEVAKNGILIDANDIVIDLNGFGLTGVAGSGKGFYVQGQHTNLVIQNGSVNRWGSVGINLNNETLFAFSFVNCVTLRNLHVSENGANGIKAEKTVIITDCLVTDNGNYGISASIGANVRGCTVLRNQSVGIGLGRDALISECVVADNGDRGIQVFNGDALVRHCNVNDNSSNGIYAGPNSSIIGCTIKNNDKHGIEVTQKCLVLNNNCSINGSNAGQDAAGIRVTGSGNRIEGNNCIGNDDGIEVPIGGNVIIKNTASGNGTNYTIVALNAFGPLVNVGGVGDISTVVNADHPWANFEY